MENAVKNVHLRTSKIRAYPSCLGVQAEGYAGFTAAALYRGVAVILYSFIAATVMPLGHFFTYQRDCKISFGIIALMIEKIFVT
jgi:hypothetical protein